MVMLDQSAAFDTVNLDILLHRLEDTYGNSGETEVDVGWVAGAAGSLIDCRPTISKPRLDDGTMCL